MWHPIITHNYYAGTHTTFADFSGLSNLLHEVDKTDHLYRLYSIHNLITPTFDPKVELDTTEELFVHKTVPLVGPYENIITLTMTANAGVHFCRKM